MASTVISIPTAMFLACRPDRRNRVYWADSIHYGTRAISLPVPDFRGKCDEGRPVLGCPARGTVAYALSSRPIASATRTAFAMSENVRFFAGKKGKLDPSAR
jgi:hypothetical protein